MTDDAEGGEIPATLNDVAVSHKKLANAEDLEATKRQLEPVMVECRNTWSNVDRCGYKRKIQSGSKKQVLPRKLKDVDGLLESVGIHV